MTRSQMTTNDVCLLADKIREANAAKQMPKKHPEGSGSDFIFFRASSKSYEN